MTNRDFVQRRKIWRTVINGNTAFLVFSKSVKTELFPERKKFLRGEVPISGFYAEEISKEPLRIKFISISQTELKVVH